MIARELYQAVANADGVICGFRLFRCEWDPRRKRPSCRQRTPPTHL